MSRWDAKRARDHLREIEDARHDQKVGGWLLVAAMLWMSLMAAGWTAVIWAGIASIGHWDAGNLVFGGGFALYVGSVIGGLLAVHAGEEYMKDRYKTVKAERAYEDYCMEATDV